MTYVKKLKMADRPRVRDCSDKPTAKVRSEDL